MNIFEDTIDEVEAISNRYDGLFTDAKIAEIRSNIAITIDHHAHTSTKRIRRRSNAQNDAHAEKSSSGGKGKMFVFRPTPQVGEPIKCSFSSHDCD